MVAFLPGPDDRGPGGKVPRNHVRAGGERTDDESDKVCENSEQKVPQLADCFPLSFVLRCPQPLFSEAEKTDGGQEKKYKIHSEKVLCGKVSLPRFRSLGK